MGLSHEDEASWDLVGEKKLEMMGAAERRECRRRGTIDTSDAPRRSWAKTPVCIKALIRWGAQQQQTKAQKQRWRRRRRQQQAEVIKPLKANLKTKEKPAVNSGFSYGGHDEHEYRTMLSKLIRSPDVTNRKVDLTKKQRNKNSYSLRSLAGVTDIQVDHIWEGQAMAAAISRTSSFYPVLKQIDWTTTSRSLTKQTDVVQNALGHVYEVHNGVDFLCASDQDSNLKKAACFRRCLNTWANGEELERDFKGELASSFKNVDKKEGDCVVELFDSKRYSATRMAENIVCKLRAVEGPLAKQLRRKTVHGAAQHGSKVDYSELADEISNLYEKLHIDKCR